MRMRLLHIRFDVETAARLDAVLQGVHEQHPGTPVTAASLVRESVHRQLHDVAYLRQLGLIQEGGAVRIRGRR
jgi:hypothetical protein